MILKEKLIRKRNEKAFTQKDLAEYLRISQTQYSRKEKGEVEITNEEWERISKLLDTSIQEIRETEIDRIDFKSTLNNDLSQNTRASYYNIPEFLLDNQQEFIQMLKKEIQQKETEIETLKKRIAEWEK